jgi:transportin-1
VLIRPPIPPFPFPFLLLALKTAVDTRAVAGIVLKNNIKKMYGELQATAPAILEDIKTQCMLHIGDAAQLVRATVGLIVTMIVSQGGLDQWPALLQTLLQLIQHADPNVMQGAFWTLHKICEDSHREMVKIPGLLETMVPGLMVFFGHADPKIRSFALSCINQFILDKPPALEAQMGVMLPNIFKIAFDPDPDVRKNVCQAIVSFLEVNWDHLRVNLGEIIEYMLRCTQDEDDQVGLEACEFWLQITEEEDAIPILAPFLPKLIPLLLAKMRYSEIDILMLRGDEDSHVADKPEDIKPHIARSKQMGGGGGAGAGAAADGEADDDEDYDDDDDDGDDETEDWSLRKCAAAGLDVLATVYGDECPDAIKPLIPGGGDILTILLPHLQAMLQSTEWEVKESGVLALGAVAEGCMEGMLPHLPQIAPFLIGTLPDPKPLVRSITCWTLSRYAMWISEHGREAGLLHNFVDGLLRRVVDDNKKVQEAACSALAVLEEEATVYLVPYIGFILQALSQAFDKYQKRNLLILCVLYFLGGGSRFIPHSGWMIELYPFADFCNPFLIPPSPPVHGTIVALTLFGHGRYDAIGTLAESVKEELAQPDHVKVMMPPLMAKWHTIANDDRELLPLLECLQTVALALKPAFLPYCEIVTHRVVLLLQTNLAAMAAAKADPELEEPDADFLIVPLDLLSAMAEAVGVAVESLVAKYGIMGLLAQCGNYPVPEVRQSAFALLGDYSQVCFVHVQPDYGNFVMQLAQQLDPKFTSARCSGVNKKKSTRGYHWIPRLLAYKASKHVTNSIPLGSPILTG